MREMTAGTNSDGATFWTKTSLLVLPYFLREGTPMLLHWGKE